MTRLQAFAESLTQEMLQTYGDTKRAVTEASGYDTTCTPARAFEAARAACLGVAERRIREFLAQAADQYAGAAMTETWAEEAEPDALCLEKPHAS